jgi:hypothetical protein
MLLLPVAVAVIFWTQVLIVVPVVVVPGVIVPVFPVKTLAVALQQKRLYFYRSKLIKLRLALVDRAILCLVMVLSLSFTQ